MLEEINFWRAEKVKFVRRLLLAIFVIVFLFFSVYSWMLYRQKVRDAQMDVNDQPQQVPSSVSLDANYPDLTNAAGSSLSPMPAPANPDLDITNQ
jgi:hypothetical protein